MSEALAIEPDLPQDVVSCAITAGCSPLAVETAINERGHTDTLLILARESDVDLMLVHALAERWGIGARCREHSRVLLGGGPCG